MKVIHNAMMEKLSSALCFGGNGNGNGNVHEKPKPEKRENSN